MLSLEKELDFLSRFLKEKILRDLYKEFSYFAVDGVLEDHLKLSA